MRQNFLSLEVLITKNNQFFKSFWTRNTYAQAIHPPKSDTDWINELANEPQTKRNATVSLDRFDAMSGSAKKRKENEEKLKENDWMLLCTSETSTFLSVQFELWMVCFGFGMSFFRLQSFVVGWFRVRWVRVGYLESGLESFFLYFKICSDLKNFYWFETSQSVRLLVTFKTIYLKALELSDLFQTNYLN